MLEIAKCTSDEVVSAVQHHPSSPPVGRCPSSRSEPSESSLLFGERLIRLNEVRNLLPPRSGGRKIGLATIYRWTNKGSHGVRLEYARVPWGRVTSVEAVERFIARLNSGHRGSPTTLTPARRQREIDRATKRLETSLGLNKTPAAQPCPAVTPLSGGHRIVSTVERGGQL